MSKVFKAFAIGMMILNALDAAREGRPAQLDVEWKGVLYRLVFSQIKMGQS